MKNKYKLIKEYPKSPKLGTVHTFVNSDGACGEDWLGTYYYEKFSEFWEEVKPKTYEILSFKNSYLFTLRENGQYVVHNKSIDWGGHSYDTLMYEVKEGFTKIHSVKRLSDGEIFTIGDKVKYGGYGTTQIVKSLNVVESRNTIYMTVVSSEWGLDFDHIVKVKEPLLVTEDGVSIYEKGQSYWFVTPGFSAYIGQAGLETALSRDLRNINFSTKEKAEEYILMNKPCLSYNDVKLLIKDWWTQERFKELVKSKL